MSNLKGDERLWMQITICPSDYSEGNMWKEEGDKVVEKIMGRQAEKKKGFSDEILIWVRNLFQAPVAPPVWDGLEKSATPAMIKFLNPAEQEIVKAIDGKTSKLGFETNFRFMYIDKREIFTTANVAAFMGTIRQFNTQNLNTIRPSSTKTLVTGWKSKFIPYYQHYMEFAKKKSLWFSYKQRRCGNRLINYSRNYGEKMMTMNIEELATLYHFPITSVLSPKLRRLETKKSGPPPSLPIGD
ncbi:hypothetical protein HY227_01545 [Candidatus Wolfebacteria bacterium]|nr:hypothetical protein [Candidatus Wolfebacteria bacterium]